MENTTIDERECRVCRTEEEPDRRLYAPCKCNGSILWTHADCLMQWLKHSRKNKCELCGYKFKFSQLYAPGAPDILSPIELIQSLIQVCFKKWIPLIFRIFIICFLWLFLAPYVTNILYRLWFLRSTSWINIGFFKRLNATDIWNDVISGIVITSLIVFSFLAFISFAEFLRFHMDHRRNDNQNQRQEEQDNRQNQQQNQNNVPDGGLQEHPNNVALPIEGREDMNNMIHDANVEPQLEQNNHDNPVNDINEINEQNDGNDTDSTNGGIEDDQDVVGDVQDNIVQEQNEDIDANNLRNVFRQNDIQHLRRRVRNNFDEMRDMPIVPPHEDQILNRLRPLPRNLHQHDNNQNERRRIPPPVRRNENNINDRRRWDDDFEQIELNIAIDELIGLHGPLSSSLRNVVWLLSFNVAYLGLFGFIPFTIGHSFISMFSEHTSVSLYNLMIPSRILNFIPPELKQANHMIHEMMKISRERGDCLQLGDLGILVAGYSALGLSALFWQFLAKTLSPLIRQPVFRSLIWVLDCLNAVVKVTCLLLLKMIITPIWLGFTADLAISSIFTGENILLSRVTFSINYPIGSLLIHWVIGISFMLFTTVSVLQLREVLHRDILANLIRQHENHPDLLRTIVDESWIKHAHRMILSFSIYMVLLFFLIYIPSYVISYYFGAIITFRYYYFCPEIQIPVELFVVHMVILTLLEKFKDEIGRWEHIWLKFVCDRIGLTEYLFPRILLYSERRNKYRSVILRPPPLHFNPRAHHRVPNEYRRDKSRRYEPWPEDPDAPLPDGLILMKRKYPYMLYFRLLLLLFVGWLSIVMVIFTCILSPLFIGRYCLNTFGLVFGGKYHDPFAIFFGLFLCVRFYSLVYMVRILLRYPLPYILDRIDYDPETVYRTVVSIILWLVCFPVLIGNCIQIILLPFQQHRILDAYFLGTVILNLWVYLNTRSICRQARRLLRHRERQARELRGRDNFNQQHNLNNEEEHDNTDEENRPAHNAHNGPLDDETIKLILSRDGRDSEQAITYLGQGQDAISQLKISMIELDYCFRTKRPFEYPVFRMENLYNNFIMPLFMVTMIAIFIPMIIIFIVTNLFWRKHNTLLDMFLARTQIGYSFLGTEEEKTYVRGTMILFVLITSLIIKGKDILVYGKKIHDYVRNDRYLIGRQLHDMER